jgi:hypothetical protein
MNINVFDRGKGQMVYCGYTEGKRFIKEAKTKNYMIVMDGYGIQEDVFPKLLELQVEDIKILETDTRKIYLASLAKWMLNGIVRDFGHGKQRFLEMSEMVELK